MIRTQSSPSTQYFSQNGQPKRIMNEKIQTAIISILSAGLLGIGTFLWNLNSTLARIEERDIDKTKSIDDLNGKINNIQLDIRDLRDKTIRIETITPHK